MNTVETLKKPPDLIYYVGVGPGDKYLGQYYQKVYRSRGSAMSKMTRSYSSDDCVLYSSDGSGWKLMVAAIYPETCAVCDKVPNGGVGNPRSWSYILRCSRKPLWEQPMVCMPCHRDFFDPRPKKRRIFSGSGGKWNPEAINEARAYYTPSLF